MFQDGDRVIIGLSGGADSVCLIVLLKELTNTLHIELKAVHVHHGLRGAEADRDASYAEELSGKLEVPFVLVRCDAAAYAAEHGFSLEEAGRILRYDALEREMKNWYGSKIAVAHHADDNTETILHNLFRGSGLKGLGGIPPVRGAIVRPLIHISREEIMTCLNTRGIAYCEDSTNTSTDYTRNKLRHLIIPTVRKEINDDAVDHILQAGRLAREADDYLEKTAESILREYAAVSDHEISIPVSILLNKDLIIQKYMVRLMLETLIKTRKDITSVHIEKICSLAQKQVGRRVDLPYALTAVRTYDCLCITLKFTETYGEHKPDFEGDGLHVPEYMIFTYEKGMNFPKNQYTKWFDYDKIKGTLSVRYRKTGDYITLASGGTKTVKSYMIDTKIPKAERDRIPLLTEGSHVLWIIGHRISAYYKITEDTRTVLQVRFDGGKHNG